MKHFISKVKNLSQKAAEIQSAMRQVPPKVAEIREAVAATTGQLQTLKSEIQYSVADLKADDENRLSTALQEINSSEEIFAKAGFILSGVDLEISPVQRLLVHLAQVEDVHASVLRSLMSANKHRRTIHAILSSMLQAKQMAETVELNELNYCELMVVVGPIPSVRLSWRPVEVVEVEEVAPVKPALPLPAPASATAPASQAAFGPGSFFEKRSGTTHPATVAAPQSSTAAPDVEISAPTVSCVEESVTVASAPDVSAPAVKHDPLARFKKMPDLSKHKQ